MRGGRCKRERMHVFGDERKRRHVERSALTFKPENLVFVHQSKIELTGSNELSNQNWCRAIVETLTAQSLHEFPAFIFAHNSEHCGVPGILPLRKADLPFPRGI